MKNRPQINLSRSQRASRIFGKSLATAMTAFLLSLSSSTAARQVEKPDAWWAEANPEVLQNWRDMGFGMFIHWGPVTISGQRIGWSRGDPTPIDVYDNLYKQFDAVNFDPDEWVSIAKEAGMKYIVLTTKHHDGFCLFDTAETEYNVMNSPMKRDVVKELAEACRKQDMPFGTYYSVCDWHHPDFPRTGVGGSVMRENSDMESYLRYMRAQVTELITNYGPLLCMWYDVPQGVSVEEGWKNVQLARELQPDILVNDRAGGHKGIGLGDFTTPERHVGDFDMERPWETCMPLGRSWSWKPNEVLKPLAECIQSLASTAGGDGNLLLNVGPTADGVIEPEQVERLREIGAWMEQYGQTIYNTRGGPFKTTRHMAATRAGNKVYVHIFGWPDEVLFLPTLPAEIVSHRLLTGGEVVIDPVQDGYIVRIPEAHRSELDTILELELDRSAMEIEPIAVAEVNRPVTEGKQVVESEIRNIRGNVRRYAGANVADGDFHKRWAVENETTQAWVEVDLGQPQQFHRAVLFEFGRGIEKFELQYKDGKRWKTFHQGSKIGEELDLEFEPITARYVRLNILESSRSPSIAEWQLYGPKKSRK